MNRSWTDSEKAVARSVLKRVESRAKTEVVRRCREYRIETPDDVWKLEQEIRLWRKELRYFGLNYDTLEETLAWWLDEGLVELRELGKLDGERLQSIKSKRK